MRFDCEVSGFINAGILANDGSRKTSAGNKKSSPSRFVINSRNANHNILVRDRFDPSDSG